MALTIDIYDDRNQIFRNDAYVVIEQIQEYRQYQDYRMDVVLAFYPNKQASIGWGAEMPFKNIIVSLPLDITQPRTDDGIYSAVVAMGNVNGVDFSTATPYVEPAE